MIKENQEGEEFCKYVLQIKCFFADIKLRIKLGSTG